MQCTFAALYLYTSYLYTLYLYTHIKAYRKREIEVGKDGGRGKDRDRDRERDRDRDRDRDKNVNKSIDTNLQDKKYAMPTHTQTHMHVLAHTRIPIHTQM